MKGMVAVIWVAVVLECLCFLKMGFSGLFWEIL